jgi:hypothetical protein
MLILYDVREVIAEAQKGRVRAVLDLSDFLERKYLLLTEEEEKILERLSSITIDQADPDTQTAAQLRKLIAGFLNEHLPYILRKGQWVLQPAELILDFAMQQNKQDWEDEEEEDHLDRRARKTAERLLREKGY